MISAGFLLAPLQDRVASTKGVVASLGSSACARHIAPSATRSVRAPKAGT